ncbi:dihydrolipoamide acetyltransferase family protein [Pseudactinotalea terrae]|uniref:dihydrolipoamide acetyltransferase family protein n=1 Tax=Pseudactinotalea terrae TaxID=1743262 RepID=UPI0012E285ED|nr:dihydrolipoamide acetyltransferase family protein [Pseudactinotalea terrae]
MPAYQPFNLPDVGEGLTEADIVEWKVSPGDTVTVNQTIVEIETAKSLVELPSPYAGVVHEVLAEVGASVDVGSPIIVIDTDPGGEAAAPSDSGGEAETSGDVLVGYGTKAPSQARRARRHAGTTATAAPEQPPAPGPEPERLAPEPAVAAPEPASPSEAAPSSAVLAKPPVRKLAKDLGVDLSRLKGTGPGGIVTREDVNAAVENEQPERLVVYPGDDRPWLDGGTVSADGRTTRVPVRSVRRRTAEAMVASAFSAPHVTVITATDVTKTMKLVKTLREERDFADVRVTPTLIAAKALILAIRRHPEISAAWDDETQEIVYKHYINLGIAAATPRGLVVPNIKDAHRLGLHDLALALSELTTTARAGRTTPAAMTGGTVTITNIGTFGIDTGTPILNPGESAILAVGAITKRPWVHKNKVKPRWVTRLALSFDHRLVDGELGSRVLQDVAATLNDPARGLVWG